MTNDNQVGQLQAAAIDAAGALITAVGALAIVGISVAAAFVGYRLVKKMIARMA